MESRINRADELHRKGYNCAQAVACAYCDLAGLDETTMFRVTEGMGLGMGCMEGTCGAAACGQFFSRTERLEKDRRPCVSVCLKR